MEKNDTNNRAFPANFTRILTAEPQNSTVSISLKWVWGYRKERERSAPDYILSFKTRSKVL